VLAGTSPFGFPMPDKDEAQSALHHWITSPRV
jgi:hypothetical protein